jgi:hypothetical protein
VDKVLRYGRLIGDDKIEGENEDYSKNHDNDTFLTEEAAEDIVMQDNSMQSDHTEVT